MQIRMSNNTKIDGSTHLSVKKCFINTEAEKYK